MTTKEVLNKLKELVNNARLPRYAYEQFYLLIELIERDIDKLKGGGNE
jgi:hypothetical protein